MKRLYFKWKHCWGVQLRRSPLRSSISGKESWRWPKGTQRGRIVWRRLRGLGSPHTLWRTGFILKLSHWKIGMLWLIRSFPWKECKKKPKCLPNNTMRITSLKVLRSELPDDRLNLENLLANLQLTGPLAGFATCVLARPFKRCPLLVSLFKRGKRPTRGRLRAYWALK